MPLETAAGRALLSPQTMASMSELWVSDGTDAGTRLVARFAIGSIPGGHDAARPLVLFGAHHGAAHRVYRPSSGPYPLPWTCSARDTRVAGNPLRRRTADFRVVLSGPSEDPVSVDFATADGTARVGVDYVATSGTLTLPPGAVAGWFTCPSLARPGARPARSTFFLDLSNAPGPASRSRGMANPGYGTGAHHRGRPWASGLSGGRRSPCVRDNVRSHDRPQLTSNVRCRRRARSGRSRRPPRPGRGRVPGEGASASGRPPSGRSRRP